MIKATGAAALFTGLAAALAAPAAAQGDEIGAAMYATACASCHGPEGRGDGVIGNLLAEAPPDLTTLSARNGGAFPMLEVIRIIEGESGEDVHSGPMPPFGELYYRTETELMGEQGAILGARGRMLSLALYLETIQQE
jgi:mono/diheme cytochrome c family protein